MKNTVLKYGIIAGAIVSIFMIVTMPLMDENSDIKHSEILGYTVMLVAMSMIFIGVRSYRNNQLNGVISFGKAFVLGLYIALIASTMYVISWMLLSEFVVTDFMEVYWNSSVEQLQSSGLSQAEIDAQLEQMKSWMEMYKNPLVKFFITYMEILPVGILVSLVSAFILKKK